jgi:queuosine biosynthesis protein QueC
VLLSGGVDSSTLLTYVGATLGVDERFAITFLYGQKHGREVACARRQAERVGVREHRLLDVEWFAQVASGSALTDESVAVPDLADVAEANRDQPPTYVPNRNMVLLSIGAAYAEARGCDAVYYGAHAGDRYGYWDCTPEFVDRLNAVLASPGGGPCPVRGTEQGRHCEIGPRFGSGLRRHVVVLSGRRATLRSVSDLRGAGRSVPGRRCARSVGKCRGPPGLRVSLRKGDAECRIRC